MNKLSMALLGGAALSALETVPAVGGNAPALHVAALHAGRVVNKTKIHIPGAQRVTYTFGVYTSESASAPPKSHLFGTFYRFSSTLCDQLREKIRAPKKSIYAKIGTATETYSLGCPSGPTTFLGDTWTNKTGKPGDTDYFVSKLIHTYKRGSVKYRQTLVLDVNVQIQ